MFSPESNQKIRFTNENRVVTSLYAFVASVTLAASLTTSKNPQTKITKPLIERCKEKYPILPSDDASSVADGQSVTLFDSSSGFSSVIKRTVNNGIRAYLNSPERSDRIARRVNGFAARMVKQANSGDRQYEFVPEGFTRPVPKKYQGFGTLYKNMYEPYIYGKGVAVPQATSNNIYRYKNGTYYAHPEPSHLSVSNHQSGAEFWAPQGLGLGPCASVPGNGVTQGWRVLYDRGGEVPLSVIQWMGSTYDYANGNNNDGYGSFPKIKKIDNHALAMLQGQSAGQ